jgi:hypothetical protein
VPFGPPFDHAVPAPGARYSADLCDYPDVLKELVYVLFQDRALKTDIFTRLDAPVPVNGMVFQRFIARKHRGGLLGLYEVINAYLDSREATLAT